MSITTPLYCKASNLEGSSLYSGIIQAGEKLWVEWGYAVENSSRIVWYQLEYSTDNGATWVVESSSAMGDSYCYTVKSGFSTLKFRVCGINSNNSKGDYAYSTNYKYSTNTPLSAPTNVTVSGAKRIGKTVTIDWTGLSGSNIEYVVFIMTEGYILKSVGTTTSTSITYTLDSCSQTQFGVYARNTSTLLDSPTAYSFAYTISEPITMTTPAYISVSTPISEGDTVSIIWGNSTSSAGGGPTDIF